MNNIYYLFSVKDQCFTDLSLILNEKKVFDHYYGLAYAKKNVLKNSIYSHVSYVSDILNKNGEIDLVFLENIEKTYNITIAEMIHTDRHLLRFEKKRRLFIAQELLRLFINEINLFKITMVFVEGVDDFISFFAAFYCARHQIKFFHSTYVGYSGRACFSSSIYCEPNGFEKIFQQTLPLIREGKMDVSHVETELAGYISAKNKPWYMNCSDIEYKPFQLKDIKTFFEYLLSYIYDRNGMHYDVSPLALPFYRLVRIIRKLRYKKFLMRASLEFDQIKNLNFLVYPLQLEPESSTFIQGRWLNDQRKIIEIISKNMPANTILLVKEHKPSIGRRALKFYKDIFHHHNVFFVNDTIDIFGLIEKSKGVVVISSSMGIEALMLKKPVMAFGERYYNVSNNVYKVNDYKAIKKTIHDMLEHKFDWPDAIALFHTLLTTTRNDLGFLSHFEYKHADLLKLAEEIEHEVLVTCNKDGM